jgi:nucleotide-binding universal stress UspA family protein
VLGTGATATAVLEQARIPVLLARWSPFGASVTDRILLAVDDSAKPDHAAEVAGLLAARHHGTVAIVPAPERNAALQRATAASGRIVLGATGVAPRVLREHVPPERLIPSVAAAVDATLLVVGVGRTTSTRSRASQIARCVGCSVLAIPLEPPPATRRME